MERRSKRGFTLTELLVVIAIITILAAISMGGAMTLGRSYTLMGEQTKLLATLGQARALAIKHNASYSVVFNDYVDDAHWYAIYQHPINPANDEDEWESIWTSRGTVRFNTSGSDFGPSDFDITKLANLFSENQVGPRRQIAPGVHFGWFRPDASHHRGDRVWPETASWLPESTRNTLEGSHSDYHNHLAQAAGLSRIKFDPTGAVARKRLTTGEVVVRVDWPKKVSFQSSLGGYLRVIYPNTDERDETGPLGDPQNRDFLGFPSDHGASRFMSLLTPHDDAKTIPFFFTKQTPYVVISLTDYRDVKSKAFSGNTITDIPRAYLPSQPTRAPLSTAQGFNFTTRVNERHVGIGVSIATGIAEARSSWGKND